MSAWHHAWSLGQDWCCALALVAALPWQSLVVGALCLALGVMVFARVQAYQSRGQIDEEA